ncbi:hypothetical protein PMO31116_02626 [Pandoraea morbifera]|uniref:Uncharacterized protein n=1 Tax=Pandoraea morbifera TaxID=2508300 RepID=A0A5E4VGF7_9BURK|nr:hypothetical protein PMO31116_02626 [Pandoraea morbifera]
MPRRGPRQARRPAASPAPPPIRPARWIQLQPACPPASTTHRRPTGADARPPPPDSPRKALPRRQRRPQHRQPRCHARPASRSRAQGVLRDRRAPAERRAPRGRRRTAQPAPPAARRDGDASAPTSRATLPARPRRAAHRGSGSRHASSFPRSAWRFPRRLRPPMHWPLPVRWQRLHRSRPLPRLTRTRSPRHPRRLRRRWPRLRRPSRHWRPPLPPLRPTLARRWLPSAPSGPPQVRSYCLRQASPSCPAQAPRKRWRPAPPASLRPDSSSPTASGDLLRSSATHSPCPGPRPVPCPGRFALLRCRRSVRPSRPPHPCRVATASIHRAWRGRRLPAPCPLRSRPVHCGRRPVPPAAPSSRPAARDTRQTVPARPSRTCAPAREECSAPVHRRDASTSRPDATGSDRCQ